MLTILIYSDLVGVLQVVASEMIRPMVEFVFFFRAYIVVETKQPDFSGMQQGILLAMWIT